MLRCWIHAKVAVLMVAMHLCACSRTHCPAVDAADDELAVEPIDPQLLAFLSRAKSAHHIADLQEDANPRGAIEALNAVVTGPAPTSNGVLRTEARETIADTQARIAELQSRSKQFDAARQRIELAMKLVPEPDYYRGHLFETQGLIEQRRSEALKSEGNLPASEVARSAALSAFETAMQIQAEVIRRTPLHTQDNPSDLPATSTSGATPIHSAPRKEGILP
ncbi:MAG TPA: hypothetical protein VIV60_03365 [Polyangiaceae bacterium]